MGTVVAKNFQALVLEGKAMGVGKGWEELIAFLAWMPTVRDVGNCKVIQSMAKLDIPRCRQLLREATKGLYMIDLWGFYGSYKNTTRVVASNQLTISASALHVAGLECTNHKGKTLTRTHAGFLGSHGTCWYQTTYQLVGSLVQANQNSLLDRGNAQLYVLL